MKNDAVRMLEVIKGIDEIMQKHAPIDWEYGARISCGPNDRPPSDAEIRRELYGILAQRSITGGGRHHRILACCLYCDFGEFDDETPNVFWGELWSYLAEKGVDVAAIKEQLKANIKKNAGHDPCNPYVGSDVLSIIAEHLNPIAVAC